MRFDRARLYIQILSIELRKALSYRIDFWIQLVGGVGIHLLIALALWSSIFTHSAATTIGGYTLAQMTLYYVVAIFFEKASRGTDYGALAQEVYDGTLTRYLLYPVNYFCFKFAAVLSHALVTFVQLLVALSILVLAGWAEPPPALWLFPAVISAVIACYLFFTMMALVELVSFWVDQVWALHVVLRFLVGFLGGSMIPLQLFPEYWRGVVEVLPFSFIISVPTRTLLGEYSIGQWMQSSLLGIGWALLIQLGASAVYRRGLKRYTGVGI